MSDSRARAADDLDDYEDFCKYWGLLRREGRGSDYTWYDMSGHYAEIFKKFDVKHICDFNKKIAELTKQGWDKEHIKDFYQIK